MNMLTNKIHGFMLNGEVPKHEELPGLIGAAKANRDSLAKNGGTPQQLQTLDNMIGIYQATSMRLTSTLPVWLRKRNRVSWI